MTPQPQVEQERHQDYVFTAPTLAPGELLRAVPFLLDADWPFELRSIAARVPYSSTVGATFGTQAGLNLISMRWSGPMQSYRQVGQDNSQTNFGLVPLNLLLGPYFGQVGNPKPVFPPIRYPRLGVITIDLQNNGPNPITGLQIVFRGVKVGPMGSWATYTYPASMGRPPLPFWYPSQATTPTVPTPALPLLTLAVTDNQLNVPFAPDNDSDFVFRSGQAGSATGTYEVFITLRDEGYKPYSNAPVPADILFGRSGFPAAFPCGPTAFVAPVGPGASQPGLLVPEIYIPKNHRMFFDIQRNDGAYAGAAPAAYPMTWAGMKVYPA
jgi:hypothetical protein